MILISLQGGIGNQLFQYATARRLAHVHNTELKLDLSLLADDKLRIYELNHFNICAQTADNNDFLLLKKNMLSKKIRTYLKGLFQGKNVLTVVREKHFPFDETVLALADNTFFEFGYWQTEKYFKDIKHILQQELTLKDNLSTQSNEVALRIQNTPNTVCLHVRRGDYVSNPLTNSVHGTCSLQYYQKALQLIEQKYPELNLFVFSDDPEWTCANIQSNHPMVFVNHNGAETAYEDLHLMSLCQHNIIANSSFSWWGAWLNQNPEKIVCYPNPWFRSEELDTCDLCPDNWHKVPF